MKKREKESFFRSFVLCHLKMSLERARSWRLMINYSRNKKLGAIFNCFRFNAIFLLTQLLNMNTPIHHTAAIKCHKKGLVIKESWESFSFFYRSTFVGLVFFTKSQIINFGRQFKEFFNSHVAISSWIFHLISSQ